MPQWPAVLRKVSTASGMPRPVSGYRLRVTSGLISVFACRWSLHRGTSLRSTSLGADVVVPQTVSVCECSFSSPMRLRLRPSGKTGGVGGRTHWELYLYSSHPVWFWGTGTHRGEPSEDRGKGIAP
uniref:Uncharacterized protein n=1 Tax=Ananas comosus var. bracteatus TaxID=296719 RepID=A0A6V7PH00_ANACO|nr:unnamed protein product [Ananas comosus var. bracteatus]